MSSAEARVTDVPRKGQLSNADIADALDEVGELLGAQDAKPFRAHAYQRAAAVVRAQPGAPRPARKIVLRGVNFDFDKATIRADARPILDEAIRMLEDARDVDVAVEGHTDAIGTDAYNQRLSERRAHAVAEYLAHGGIARSRMTVQGFGESRPIATNATEDGRAQNRRVELHVAGQ